MVLHPCRRSLYMIGLILRYVGGALLVSGLLYGLMRVGVLGGGLGWVLIVLVLASGVGVVELYRRTTVYRITNTHVMLTHGILRRVHNEFHVRKIQSTRVEQNLLERYVLKVGDVHLESAAPEWQEDDVIFRGVANPRRVAQFITNAELGTLEGDHGGSTGGNWAPAPADTGDGLDDVDLRPPGPLPPR